MKRWFATLSIRHKLSTIVLFASTVALVLATVFSFFIQHYFIRQQLRDEILATRQADIAALAGLVGACMKENYLCVLGDEEKIKESQALFGTVQAVFS